MLGYLCACAAGTSRCVRGCCVDGLGRERLWRKAGAVAVAGAVVEVERARAMQCARAMQGSGIL